MMAILEEFCLGNYDKERIKKSHIFLLQKCQGADEVDFHPISLSNSTYLIIAKVLANRLREVIDELIELFQLVLTPLSKMVR